MDLRGSSGFALLTMRLAAHGNRGSASVLLRDPGPGQMDGAKRALYNAANRFYPVAVMEEPLMTIRRLLPLAALICSLISAAYGQKTKLDPGFFGLWNLDVGKSDFASQPKPKMGQVNWGDHGWAFALVLANGELFTDGVQTDGGCIYVGEAPLTCEYELVTPRHVRLTMKHGATVIRVGEIELLEDGTTRTTHRVTPSDGPPYIEKTIWVKQK